MLVPMHVLPSQVWPSLQRFQTRPVGLCVTVASALGVYAESGLDGAGILAAQVTAWTAAALRLSPTIQARAKDKSFMAHFLEFNQLASAAMGTLLVNRIHLNSSKSLSATHQANRGQVVTTLVDGAGITKGDTDHPSDIN